MKPIAMKCNQQQFDAIKPKLVGLDLKEVETIDYSHLVNNLDGKFGVIGNLSDLWITDFNRQVFEKWNEEVFLQYCGIKFILPKNWAIKGSKELAEWNKENKSTFWNLDDPSIFYFFHNNYWQGNDELPKEYVEITFEQFKTHVLKQTEMKTLPKYFVIKADVSNPLWDKYILWLNETYNRCLVGNITVDFYEFDGKVGNCTSIDSFHNNPEILTLQQWDEIINKPMQNLTQQLTLGQLKELFGRFDCTQWSSSISDYLEMWYLEKDDFKVSIEQKDIDLLMKKGSIEQKETIKNLGVQLSNPIQWDKIKTGSKVMIEYTGQHCSGIELIDLNNSVDVVFFKSKSLITGNAEFQIEKDSRLFCTFYQKSRFVLFNADNNTDYITEVIQY